MSLSEPSIDIFQKYLTGLSFVASVIKESYQCINRENMVPVHRPLVCEYSKRKADVYVGRCCDDSDMCNRGLNLTLSGQVSR